MQPDHAYHPHLRRWLMSLMVLVVLMVALGGFTRLTESGLSIVEWKLVSGILPPLTQEGWNAEFAQYQSSPQYEQVNRGFSVDDFKRIFWLEYLHRLLGRIIGLAVIVPLAWFAARRMLPRPMQWRGLLLVALVAMQGAVGWIMVASGLVDAPRVAPVKLALHLSLAFMFFLAILGTYWHVRGLRHIWRPGALALFALIFVQVVFGALVAGLDAGLSYNTYPLMDGQFIPDRLHALSPWWKNHLENLLTVQFQHRMGALAVAAGCMAYAAWHYRMATPAEKRVLHALLAVVALQFALGVATLLSVVDMWLAVAHQLAAMALLAVAWRLLYRP